MKMAIYLMLPASAWRKGWSPEMPAAAASGGWRAVALGLMLLAQRCRGSCVRLLDLQFRNTSFNANDAGLLRCLYCKPEVACGTDPSSCLPVRDNYDGDYAPYSEQHMTLKSAFCRLCLRADKAVFPGLDMKSQHALFI